MMRGGRRDSLQRFMVILSYTVFLKSMDWLTTGLAFTVGLVEVNPLVAEQLSGGALRFFAAQWLAILVFALLLWLASRYVELWKVLLLETGVLLYPVIHNTVMIVLASTVFRQHLPGGVALGGA